MLQLSDGMKSRAERQASLAGFDSIEGYLKNLIEMDLAVPISAKLEAEILAAINGPGGDMGDADWSQLREEFRERHTPTTGQR